jgi:ABC-2 type transport system permease protein
MQVFKSFFRVIRSNAAQLSIYVVVFAALSIAFTNFSPAAAETDFSKTRINFAFINRDVESPLVKGLLDYLGENGNLVTQEDDPEALQDALFFRDVEYIVYVPSGFRDQFLRGEAARLQRRTAPDSQSGRYLDLLVDQYCSTAQLYLKGAPGITEPELAEAVARTLAEEATVHLQQANLSGGEKQSYTYYYNYLSYIMMALILLCISTALMVFNQPDLRRRNLCSPLSSRSINGQLALGCVLCCLCIWAIMAACSLVLYQKQFPHPGIFLLSALNALCYTAVCMSVGFFAGIFVRSSNVQSAVTNVVSLGLSFLSGVFVPQELLGESVLNVAKFLPTYWYIRVNEDIGVLSGFQQNDLSPLFPGMLLQLAFAAAIFSVALLVSKQRRASAV